MSSLLGLIGRLADLIDQPFELLRIPLDDWAKAGVDWSATHLRAAFQVVRWPLAQALDGVEGALVSAPPLLVILVAGLLIWQVAGPRIAAFGVGTLLFLGFAGVWTETVTTLAIVLSAVLFCVAIGLPLGILAARHRKFETLLRPALDVMQSVPAFVYLVPIAMLVGIGNVPGVMATIVFALPPMVRLTTLGMRNVPVGSIEAAQVLGLTRRQILLLIELPLALKEIMAGVNQTIMMALAMCVVSSMIAVQGLGMLVLRGIGSLDIGLATQGGVGIVLLAILLDRTTQGIGSRSPDQPHWYERGPVGLLRRLGGAAPPPARHARPAWRRLFFSSGA